MITAGLPGKAKESKPHFNSSWKLNFVKRKYQPAEKRKEETKKKQPLMAPFSSASHRQKVVNLLTRLANATSLVLEKPPLMRRIVRCYHGPLLRQQFSDCAFTVLYNNNIIMVVTQQGDFPQNHPFPLFPLTHRQVMHYIYFQSRLSCL